MTLMKFSLLFIPIILFSIGSVPCAAQTSTQEKGTIEVKEKVTDVDQAIKDYSVNQRDEALKKAQAALRELDFRIDTMKSQVNKKFQEMDQSARKKAKIAFRELKKMRNEVSEWYDRLENNSSKEWEDIKKGFLKSYRELRDTFDEVRDAKNGLLKNEQELQDALDKEQK